MSVRVRFAPSPTGWLHVGGARTAYFNWLFARQHGGAFVVRIEDTDVERSSPESERGVLDDLHWLGLDPDEGPEQGGPYGPYRQSERLALYRERAEALVARGLAYPCFCTDAELEARRAAALAAGRPPHYDGRCRDLTAGQRAARAAEGRPRSVRFAVAPREWVLADRVRGEVRFPAGMVGDFVLLRASGLPTYNFACVVDDAGMRISHVIRAEEHLPNTARQLMLYEALGELPPVFAHLALILNPDRSKMSKRTGEAAVAVGDWRRAGYVPEALLAYLALLGFHPGDEREVLSRAELLEAFTLERVGKSGSVFDADRLRWMNAHHLHHADGATLLGWGAAFLPPALRALPEERQMRILECVRGNLTTLADLPGETAAFLPGEPPLEDDARAALEAPGARALCAALAVALGQLETFDAKGFKSAVLSVGEALGRKGKALFQPVRAALTGRTHGPELPLVAELIGRDVCIGRLARAGGAGARE
uniref:Glutamate--tRNA ligase n=1 Tax=Eiseniibacteriota bacterium TaxID=2212470 RepID=A0A832I7M2_UNCEI